MGVWVEKQSCIMCDMCRDYDSSALHLLNDFKKCMRKKRMEYWENDIMPEMQGKDKKGA